MFKERMAIWSNLDPGLPPKKLYDNLRGLGVVNKPEGFGADVDVERMHNFFLLRQSVGY
jgi:hypothetical protein